MLAPSIATRADFASGEEALDAHAGRRRAPRDPLLGTIVGGTYRLVGTIAHGGMGRLYEAEHLRVERRYAIKVIHEQYASHPDAHARFKREARAAGRVRSDHVVDVLDVLCTSDGRPCIVTALLDGEDLHRQIERDGPLPPRRAIRIARQMCRGLAAAHAAGVIHRDVKPSNVFITQGTAGDVQLLDFGVAKLDGSPEITRTGAVVGTPAYMAPEQARGATAVDARADVYGVGAVLYHMLAGSPPYPAADPTRALAALLERGPAPLCRVHPGVPEVLGTVVDKAMARDPAQRPQSMAELSRLLDAADAELGATSSSGEDDETPATLVLPAGAVAEAKRIAREARMARPRAVVWSLLLTGASALAAATVAAHLLDTWAPSEARTPVGSVLVVLSAVLMATAAAVALIRRLHPQWSSTTAIVPLAERIRRGVVVAGTTMGLWHLTASGTAALGLASSPSVLAPLLVASGLGVLAARKSARHP